jgi:hypothetical protein
VFITIDSSLYNNNIEIMTGTNGNGNGAKIGTDKVKQGLAQMLKGGVIVSLLCFCESLNIRTDFCLCFARVLLAPFGHIMCS